MSKAGLDENDAWVVSVIDAGCSCCSYVPVKIFSSLREAKVYVSNKVNSANYTIDEW